MFNVQGIVRGTRRQALVQWDGGNLTGDESLVELVEDKALGFEGEPIGPPEGPYTTTAHLSDPLSALVLIADEFEPGSLRYAGELPSRGRVPTGAIG